MAKIISNIDYDLHFADTKLAGEKIVFDILNRKLSNEWTVYYSVDWFGSSNSFGTKRDGEIDFLITHPRFGVFVCEVKGGIKIEVSEEKWYSTNKRYNRIQIKDPFRQAKSNNYFLASKYKEEIYSNNVTLNSFHFVIFPEVDEVVGIEPFYVEDSIYVTSIELANIERKLIDLYNNKAIFPEDKKDAITDTSNYIKWLSQKLLPNISYERNIKNWLTETENKIIELSQEQFRVYSGLWNNKKINISGCAGSGKTILATNRAKELADSGLKTLLVCFNVVLGSEFERFSSKIQNLLGTNFDKLLYKLNDIHQIVDNRNILISLLQERIINDELDLFDAIIIDEAQDFNDTELELLRLCTKEDGYFVTFSDSNQQIQGGGFNLFKGFEFHLSQNYRNSKPIFDILIKHYYDNNPINHGGPLGVEVKLLKKYPFNNTSKLHDMLKLQLDKLLKEGIKESDITILTFKSKDESELNNFKYNKQISIFDEENKDVIRIETIRRFKGMDSSVVILTELDSDEYFNDNEKWNKLCYVGYSRARSLLIILPASNIEQNRL